MGETLDFDELMLLLLNELELKHPEGKRFDKLIKTYFDTFEKLKNKIEAKPDNEESKPLKEAFHLVSDKIIEEGEYPWAIPFHIRLSSQRPALHHGS